MNQLTLESQPREPKICSVGPSAPFEDKNVTRKYWIIGASVVAVVVLMATLISVHFSYDDKGNKDKPGSKPTGSEMATTAPPASTQSLQPDVHLRSVLHEVVMNMDQSVKPCDDFYEYACGSFRKRYPLLKNKTEVNYFSLHEDRVYSETVSLLSDEKFDSRKIASLKYLKRIWDSCVKDESSTGEQMKRMSSYFKELDQLNSWQDKFIKLTKDGYNALFTLRMNHVDEVSVHVGPPKFEFNTAHSTSSSIPLMRYYIDLIRLYSGRRNIRLAKEIMDFEQRLSASVTPDSESALKSHSSTLAEANDKTDINWLEVLKSYLATAKMTEKERVNLDDVQYVNNFKKTTDGRDDAFWNEYFKVKVMQQTCFFLGKECRAVHLDLAQSVNKGQDEVQLVERTCFDTLAHHLEDLLFKVRNEKNEVLDKPAAYYTKMSVSLMENLMKTIDEITWMDEKAKDWARVGIACASSTKELKMPSYLNKNSMLDLKYSDAPLLNENDVSIFDYFSNLIKYSKSKEFDEKEINSRPKWPVSLFSSKPFIAQEEKKLFLPHFFVSGPLVSNALPDAVKFGALGSQLAHEMTHSFDNVAVFYEESRDRHDSWSEGTKAAFRDKMQCLVDAFDESKVKINGKPTNLKINGSFTLDENLADLIGLDVAYGAFLKKKESNNFDKSRLPAPLNEMNQEQLFFLSYANVHCANEIAPKNKNRLLQTPRRNRVNVVLAHSEKFGDAFHCSPEGKASSDENPPPKKCSFIK